ncbi:MAG: hypothetical protein ACRDYZ_03870 [Acidimicrobiales bacterium]
MAALIGAGTPGAATSGAAGRRPAGTDAVLEGRAGGSVPSIIMPAGPARRPDPAAARSGAGRHSLEDVLQPPDARRVWFSRRAILLHVTVVVVVPLFFALFWWQVQRVRQGNTLSWAYVFEWPFFAAYAVYLWWRLVHEQPANEDAAALRPTRAPGAGATAGPTPAPPSSPKSAAAAAAAAEEADEELSAYNRYLAELNATGQRKRW